LEGDIWGDPEIPVTAEGDDDDDDDVDVMEAPIREHASTLPRPPLRDIFGNPFVTIVDASGIHHVPVVGCSCDRQDPNIDIPYLKMGLFATSFERIQTVFTFEVLKDFRLSNLECKTTAYQYYQKLRRLTCPEFPKAVLNRYRELRRLSREYRNLKLWKIHGRAHDEPEGPGIVMAAGMQGAVGRSMHQGQQSTIEIEDAAAGNDQIPRGRLASFCPACPQPGINLPDAWQDDPQRFGMHICIPK
jgi:hypothetical protein